jgi:hypothetical protein
VTLAGRAIGHKVAVSKGIARVELEQAVTIEPGGELRVETRA